MKLANPLSALGQRTDAPPITWLMDLALRRPEVISLAAGFTDNESLPTQVARDLLMEILAHKNHGQAALQYGTTAGERALRQLVSERLGKQDYGADVPADIYSADNFLITHGSQQLLYLLTECLCDPGDLILVEDPTYFVYLGIVQSHGLSCRGIRMETDGIELAHLEATLESLKKSGEIKRLKMLYLVTYYQNPTGRTTSFAKKAAALELLSRYEKAAGHPIYLLEDAAYRELRFAGEDVHSALRATKHAERVVYAGTFSKPFATGVRVGFGWMPELLRTAVVRAKGNHDFGTSNLLQQLLCRALASGRFEAHLTELRKRYARKAGIMERAMREHFPKSVTWETAQGGLYFWPRVKGLTTGNRSKLFQTALKRDVLYIPGQVCYADDATRRKPNHEMRLSFGGASETNIREGIARLGRVLHELLEE